MTQDVFTTSRMDDGKGRFWERKPEAKDVVPMHLKDNLDEMLGAGDYAVLDFDVTKIIGMRCPFCNREAPVPTLVKVNSYDPLDIEDVLGCGFCLSSFYVVNGVAIRNWAPVLQGVPCTSQKL